jgi:Na+/H+ antiporter NhaD/arsenite permease-like protein
MTIAVLTFSVTYILLMLEKIPRYIVSLIGASVIIISGVLTMDDAVHFVSWETIGLLLGMFIIISVLEHGNFFNYLAVRVIQSVKFDIRKIYLIFPIITAVLSGFMDSITVMLFFTILTINLCKLFELNPVPLVIAEVCTANIGGSATLVGDPPNVIIGSILGYDFNDFITNTAPIAIIATIVVTLVFFALNQKKLKVTRSLSEDEKISVIQNNQITNGRYVYIGIIAFSSAIFILLLHPIVNSLFGFHINASIATLVPALVCLFFLGADEGEKVLKSIDSVTFLFFIGLFIVVGALEKTGAIAVMSDYMMSLAGGQDITFSTDIYLGLRNNKCNCGQCTNGTYNVLRSHEYDIWK